MSFEWTYTVKTASSEDFREDYIEERAVELACYIVKQSRRCDGQARQFGISEVNSTYGSNKKNYIEILYIWLNDKRERTINLDVYSFFSLEKY